MASDGTSWNIDRPFEVLQPITSNNGHTFSSSILLTDPPNEKMTIPSSICLIRPLFDMLPTTQAGVSLGEAQALLASPLFNISPTFYTESSSWMNPTTEDALLSSSMLVLKTAQVN